MFMRRGMKAGGALGLLLAVGAVAGSSGWFSGRWARSSEILWQEGAPQAQREAGRPTAVPAPAKSAPESQEDREIRAFDQAYANDFNKADAKALGARFTEDAEVHEEDGSRFQGRALIEEWLAETLAANKGAKLAIEIETIRVLSPDVVKEEGRTTVTSAKGEPLSHRRYTVLLVKQSGRWLISSVREEPDHFVRPHDRLKVLEWLVGDWIDEGSDSLVRIHCRWSEDGNFLVRVFKVHEQGKEMLTVTQHIGWDPVADHIRSWEFDSEGGFGEGKWGGDGDRWVVKRTGTRPDGATVSATNTFVRERPDLVRWTSTDRIVRGESIPDDETFAFVRVPPAPRAHTEGPANPAPATNREGRPQ
jgi:uncharacterized protein (TIGR02246 family)